MTEFYKSGDAYSIVGKERGQKVKEIPPGTFLVKASMSGFYVDKIEDFELPNKVYGNVDVMSERILTTYASRTKNTGVLLAGEKGSGKTLLAKSLAIKAMGRQIPTLVINEPFCGDSFNEFMQAIHQPTIVFLDEFEKVYSDEQQESMLTLLDGVYKTKKLFVLTCNDIYRVNSFMKNRPSRIFYQLTYKGLDPAFVEEYSQDNLKDKKKVSQVTQVASLFNNFNFDILASLVEEMNRYDETAVEALEYLNAQVPEDYSSYSIKLLVDEEEIKNINASVNNPLTVERFTIQDLSTITERGGTTAWLEQTKKAPRYEFRSGDMVAFDAKAGEIVYKTKEATVVFTRVREKEASFSDYHFRAL